MRWSREAKPATASSSWARATIRLIDFARELVERLAAELIADCGVSSDMAKPGTVIGWKLPERERETAARALSAEI